MATKKTDNDKKALVFKIVYNAAGHWWRVDKRQTGDMVTEGDTAYSRKDNAKRAMLKFIEQVQAGNFEVEE